jgi:hypothetical protein
MGPGTKGRLMPRKTADQKAADLPPEDVPFDEVMRRLLAAPVHHKKAVPQPPKSRRRATTKKRGPGRKKG